MSPLHLLAKYISTHSLLQQNFGANIFEGLILKPTVSISALINIFFDQFHFFDFCGFKYFAVQDIILAVGVSAVGLSSSYLILHSSKKKGNGDKSWLIAAISMKKQNRTYNIYYPLELHNEYESNEYPKVHYFLQ